MTRRVLIASVLLVLWSSVAIAETRLCGRVFTVQRPLRAEEVKTVLLEGVDGAPHLVDLRGTGQRSLVVLSEGQMSIATVESGSVVRRTLAIPPGSVQRYSGDFDGNGCEDLALVSSARQVSVAWSNCSTFEAVGAWIPELPVGEIFSGDLNGDGRDDLVVARATGAWRAFVSEGRSAPRKLGWLAPFQEGVTRWIADRNSDGRADLSILSADGAITWGSSDGVRGFVPVSTGPADFDRTRRFERFFLGDFDGDGLTEQVAQDTNRNSLCLLRPDSGLPTQCPFAHFLGETPWTNVAVGDFDGDGADELLVYRWRARAWTRYRWRFDRGEEDRPWLPVPDERAEVVAGDLDGDGLDDLIYGEHGSWSFVRSRFSAPVSGVTVTLRSGSLGVSDVTGQYCAQSAVLGEELLEARSQPQVDPPYRIVKLSRTAQERDKLNFLIDREPTAEGPQLCVGLVEGSWGRQGRCPRGYAFYGLDDSSDARSGPASGPCCPLPMKDIQIGEPFSADLVCPELSMLIGWERRCESCGYSVLCVRVNPARYQLGPETAGVYWGFGFSRWDESQFIPKMNLPPNLRHAVGRMGFAEWDIDGCVGVPLGSVLTGRPEGFCSGTRFRQLQYRGLAGDPPQGTPVKMLQECREVVDLFSAGGRCRR